MTTLYAASFAATGAAITAPARAAMRPPYLFLALLAVGGSGWMAPAAWAAAALPIHFDMAPVAVARPAEASEFVTALPGQRLVVVPLRLSSLVRSPQPPSIDQLMIHIYCVDPSMAIADYSPHTELSSELEGNVEVQQSEESSKHLGFSIDAAQGHLLRGNLGGDAGSKDLQTLKFQRVAPLEVALASGTTHRGRGVYFKFRATARQVLEGDKRFSVTLAVPASWRGGQLEVRVSADTLHRALPGLDPAPRTVGAARFAVTLFLEGDEAMHHAVRELARAELKLREAARLHAPAISRSSNPSLFQQVAAVFDLGEPPVGADWLHRVLLGNIDADLQIQIRRLPIDVRVAVLDYQQARRRFLETGQPLTDLAIR